MFLLYVLFCLHFTCLNQDLYKATCWSWLVGLFSFFSSTGFVSTSLSLIFLEVYLWKKLEHLFHRVSYLDFANCIPKKFFNVLLCLLHFLQKFDQIRSFGLGQSYFKLSVTCRILVDALDYQVGEVPFCSQFAKSFIRTGCQILSKASCIF